MAIRGLAHAQVEVKGVGNLDRANLGAFSTAGANFFLDIARFATHSYVKVADKTRDRLDFAVAEQLDVFMASHGHHLGGENSSCAV